MYLSNVLEGTMLNIGQLMKKIKTDKIISSYTNKNRFIENKIYKKLKRIKYCTVCSKKKGLQIHHILPVREGGNNYEGNLVVVCRKCHSKIHSSNYSAFVIYDYNEFKDALKQMWYYIRDTIEMKINNWRKK